MSNDPVPGRSFLPENIMSETISMLKNQIESLTKERDELLILNVGAAQVDYFRKCQKLEAENAQIKAGWKADFNNWEKAKENNTILAVKLAFAENTMATRLARVEELYEKLTTSEKENAKLKEQLSEMEKNLQHKIQ